MPHRLLRGVLIAVSVMLLGACAGGGRDGRPATPSPPLPDESPTPGHVTPVLTAPVGATPDATEGLGAEPPTDGPTPAGTPAGRTAPASLSPGPGRPFDPEAVQLTLEPFAAGLDALTYLTHAGDGSALLYAVEQRGVVRVVEPAGGVRPAPFLDITDRVRAGGERGLLGLAFHPAYAENGRLFVNYTDRNGDTVVAEFARTGADTADPASERVLLTIDQPFANHNGGMIAFGPDGYLYIATGDGGGGGDPLGTGQDTSDLLGAILRIDVDATDGEPYGIPPDNPLVDTPSARPEIWAWGLRNPWRFSFDRRDGGLFIGDVGQGAWEEIDAAPAGAGGQNYGWNVMEGPDCFARPDCDTSGLTLPVASYPRADGQCSVTGGYVYRGQRQPTLEGGYLFADYCSGLVFGLDATAALTDGEASIARLGNSGVSVTSFGEDEAGELYLVAAEGEIVRLAAER